MPVQATYPEMIQFGKRLHELRGERGWSQAEFGERLGGANTPTAPGTVSAWENANKRPTVDTIMNIANLFGVPIGYLLGMEDRRTQTIDIFDALEALKNVLSVHFYRNGSGELHIACSLRDYLCDKNEFEKAINELRYPPNLVESFLSTIKDQHCGRINEDTETDMQTKIGKHSAVSYPIRPFSPPIIK